MCFPVLGRTCTNMLHAVTSSLESLWPLVLSFFSMFQGSTCSRDTQLLSVTGIPKGSWASHICIPGSWCLLISTATAQQPDVSSATNLGEGRAWPTTCVVHWQSCQGVSLSAGSHSLRNTTTSLCLVHIQTMNPADNCEHCRALGAGQDVSPQQGPCGMPKSLSTL